MNGMLEWSSLVYTEEKNLLNANEQSLSERGLSSSPRNEICWRSVPGVNDCQNFRGFDFKRDKRSWEKYLSFASLIAEQ